MRTSQNGLPLLCLVLLVHFVTFGSRLPFSPEEIPHYVIALEVDFKERSFRGVERIEYVNTTGTRLEEIFFRLYPNASAIYGDGSLRVEEVQVNGEPVEIETFVSETILMVSLPSPLDTGASISLQLSFEGWPSEWRKDLNRSTRLGYGIYASSEQTMTLASFYPILAVYDEEGWNIDPVGAIGDPVFSEVASYEVSITTEPDLFVLTSGRFVDQELEEEQCTYRFIGERMRDFIVILGKGYVQCTDTVGDVLLRTSFFPGHILAGETTMALAKRAITLFEALFGPYAYEELDLVEVPLERVGGVEYPGLILIAEAYCENPYDLFFDVIVSHETAHQWWYATVGNDVVEEPWLDEACATYASALFLEETYGTEVASANLDDWRTSYLTTRSRYPQLAVGTPLYLFPDSATYSAFVYSGGALFLDEVRRRIGDGAFFDAIANYYHDRAFRIAHRSDLLSHFEEACDCDLLPVFSYYLDPEGAVGVPLP